jgi:hypothetical protein
MSINREEHTDGDFRRDPEIIDLESPDWYRLRSDREPRRPAGWGNSLYGGADIARSDRLESLLSPPWDEEDPCCFEDVSLILADGCQYKRRLYLPAELRNQNILITSVTGGGKTQRFLFPLLLDDLRKRIPCVSLDSKSEQYDLLRRMGARPGHVEVWNPGDARRTTAAINPLDLCGDDPGLVLDVCQTFVMADKENKSSGSGDGHWFDMNAARMIAGAVLEIRRQRGSACFADVLALLERPMPQIKKFFWNSRVPFMASILSFIETGSHNAETILATARNASRLFVNPDLAAATSITEIDLDHVVQGRKILVVEVDPDRVAFLRPVLTMFFTLLFQRAIKISRQFPGGRFPHGLRFHIDDFAANLGRIPGLPGILNMMRGRNFGTFATVQTMGQLADLYGREFDAVLAGFGSKLFQSPVEIGDAEMASKMSGTTTLCHVEYIDTLEETDLEPARTTRVRRPVARSLLLPDEIRHAPNHFAYGSAATCFFLGLPPFQAWFRPIHEMPAWQGVFAASRKARKRALRRRPLTWLPDFGMAFTSIKGWTDREIKALIDRNDQALGLKSVAHSIRDWWNSIKLRLAEQPETIVQLQEELLWRQAGIGDLYLAYKRSGSDNIAANLIYVDFLKAKRNATSGQTGA